MAVKMKPADWREDLADIRAALPKIAIVGDDLEGQARIRRALDAEGRIFRLLLEIERTVRQPA